MYSKSEAKEKVKLFWTSYGKYMKKHVPLFPGKIKWTNYKTGVKDIYFRLRVDKKTAEIAIEIQHKDDGIRALFYDQFLELKGIFTTIVGEWDWDEVIYNDQGNKISKISKQLEKVNVFDQNTWMAAFLLFEKSQLGFDEFWSEFGDVFKLLEE